MRTATASHVFTLLLVAGLVAVVAAPAHAQFVTYDNFSGGVIDPEKWEANSVEGSVAAPTGKALRVVADGSLRMALTSWGGNSSDSGFVTTRERLNMRQLGTLGGTGFITGIKAQVTMLEADVQDCATNSVTETDGVSALRARAEILGWFFNDGSGGPKDRTGNIIAAVQLIRGQDGANRVDVVLSRCSDAGCTVSTVPLPTVTFSTLWVINTPLVVELAWNKLNGKFTVTVTNPSTLATESHDVVYQGTIANAGPPTVGGFDAVQVRNSVKNCTTARKRVVTDALFDNVQVRRQP